MKKVIMVFNKNLKWIIAIITLILFLLIMRKVYLKDIIEFDNYYYEYISLLISSKMTFFVKILTNLGSAFSLIALTILILLVLKEKKYGVLTGINLIVIFLFNLILKFLFARPRPLNINLIDESGYSFPSGHAMVSTAFYGFMIYLIWQTKISKKYKWLYSFLLSLLILFICISRVYLGVHYASDVFGGMFISISYLILFTSITSKYLSRKKSSK